MSAMMHKICAVAAFGALLFGGALSPASAATDVIIPSTEYASFGANSGVDTMGNPWSWGTTIGGVTGPGAGYSAWGTPGLGAGVATYQSATVATDFQVTFLGFAGAAINETPSTTAGGYTELTRFTANGIAWEPTFNGTDIVTFNAPSGAFLTKGEDFFVNIVFNQTSINGMNTGFEAAFSTSAPEVSSWAMLLLGFAGLGCIRYAKSRRPAIS